MDDYEAKFKKCPCMIFPERIFQVKAPQLKRWMIKGLFNLFSVSFIEIMVVWIIIYYISYCYESNNEYARPVLGSWSLCSLAPVSRHKNGQVNRKTERIKEMEKQNEMKKQFKLQGEEGKKKEIFHHVWSNGLGQLFSMESFKSISCQYLI